MKAILKNYRQSPRKVRLVANLIRGKRVQKALTTLLFLDKKSALPIKKLLESAVSNALQKGEAKKDELTVKDIQVNAGISFIRYRPRARGQAAPIRRRTSTVKIALGKGLEKETREEK